jgi:transmembrane 9 superfamily protein 2/4
MYKFFNGTYWILLAIISSCALPLFLASTLFVIDICEYIETKRASIVPVSDIFVLFILWLSLNVPMTLLGAFVGFRSAVFWTPGKLNRVAR